MPLWEVTVENCYRKVQILNSDHPSLGAGHYTAFARQDDASQWNYFNDAHVSFPFFKAFIQTLCFTGGPTGA